MISKDVFMEAVCEVCPATCWGKKSHCQVHDKHVGKIDSCPEWDKYMGDQKAKGQQKTVSARKEGFARPSEQAPSVDFLQKAEEEIRDYNYMQIEIVRIQRFLREAGEGMVAQYGLDSGMPKGKGTTGDRTHAEVARRERKWKRLQNLQDKIERINKAVETIPGEQERLVVEALLDGDKNNLIAKEIGVSRQRYYEIKRSAVMKMAWAMYGDQAQQTG
ncbi:hypothetical protein ABER61_16010 [Brevibacillus formosus]|uniref:Uncharacterized protein n=1 Tax=Brevibacillus formosus TaxID=54913 RepID=A0A837KNM8_9BACL|nr:hypothetical protein [Brevibacillus formosus]KLH98783.1 hypothetical protein AA984_09560 [Brevibacillus formosus]MED1958076.1 hypothetical protein [Brevibacillus formosus]PSJ89237.1 hypothetical protein C7R91_27730 [Brevibacillus formosus]GED59397.1 hypothetical protein BFO01nite_35290 [Brevibacillus formosus]